MEESFLTADAEDGKEITVWNDINPQTTSTLTATAVGGATGLKYSVNGINNLPALEFEGTKALSSPTPPVTNYSSTVFIVYKVTGSKPVGTLKYIYSWNSSLIRGDVGGVNGARYNGTSTNYAFTFGDVELVPEIATTTLTGGASTDILITYINGVKTLNIAGAALGAVAITAPSPFYIGNRTIGQYHTGFISEVIAFDGVLKTSDRKAVEAYLGKKYGIKVS